MAAAATIAILTLGGCGQQSGKSLAHQACTHVHRSLQFYALSTHPGIPSSARARLRTRADAELRAALPLAAAANSDDGSWNSLMTTISEITTVDESHLVPALTAQCAVADANPNVNPESSP